MGKEDFLLRIGYATNIHKFQRPMVDGSFGLSFKQFEDEPTVLHQLHDILNIDRFGIHLHVTRKYYAENESAGVLSFGINPTPTASSDFESEITVPLYQHEPFSGDWIINAEKVSLLNPNIDLVGKSLALFDTGSTHICKFQ